MKNHYPIVRVRARTNAGNIEVAPPSSTPSTLEALAERLVRLSWSWTDPEAAHLEKHSIAAEMRSLARSIRRGAA